MNVHPPCCSAKDDAVGLDASDDVKKKKDQDDKQNRADPAASVIPEAWAHAHSAEAKDQDQDDKKDNHAFSVQVNFTALSEMQNLIGM